jgi:hypothetical protein
MFCRGGHGHDLSARLLLVKRVVGGDEEESGTLGNDSCPHGGNQQVASDCVSPRRIPPANAAGGD